MILKISEIAEITGGVITGNYEDCVIEDVAIDSRKANEKTIFIPFVGENADGHNYIKNAAENGCRVCFSEKDCDADITVIRVENCEKALGKLASFWIDKINPVRIAVTGSVGKTTTRDMIAAVTAKAGKTLKTQGNFNNNIGLPLTVLKLTDEKIAVLEMGMDRFGEIDYLSGIVKPDIGVITNIGYSHLERLGSRENILKAKTEMVANMAPEGFMILNGDDDYLPSLKNTTDIKKIYYGCENKESDICFEITDEKTGEFIISGERYCCGQPGRHNMYNASAAVAIGKHLGLSVEEINEGLQSMEMTGLRLKFEKKDGYTIICDCYNAAPDSMRASLRVLKDTEGKRKIAVLAAINELGEARDGLLYEVGKFAAEMKIDKLVTVGPEALAINKGAKDGGLTDEINIENNRKAGEYLLGIAKEEDVFLVKGSRGFKLEEICDYMMRKEEENA